MDAADAVNILSYASASRNKKKAGSAAWNIFPRDAAPIINNYLRDRKVLEGENHRNLIHSQNYFLTSQDRKILSKDYGVKSWRINQETGDAVYIPAGCAHQVSNREIG